MAVDIFTAQGTLQNMQGQNVDRKTFAKALEDYMVAVRKLEMENPEAFQKWYQENPEWGIRYDAQMATGRHFVGDHPMAPEDTKVNRARAEAAGLALGQEMGFGEDGKMDGKSIQSGYGTQWNDVNNEGGPGDFFKLGTPGAMSGGFLDFVEDNPLQVAGMVASMAMPWLSPYVAGALGVTSTLGTAALTAGLTTGVNLLSGQDLDDALLAGALSGGTYYLKNAADVAKFAGGVADDINATLGTTLDANDVINSGLAVVKQNPEGLMEVVIPQGMDAVFEQMKPVSDWMNENGWSTDAISDAMVKYAKSGGDVQKAAIEWVREGGVGDIPLPEVDIDLNMPDIFSNIDWREMTDPIEEAVQNIPNPFENVDTPNWGGSESGLFNLPNVNTPNWEGSESVDIPETEALQWPGPIENPLPEMPDFLPNVDMPEVDAPGGGGFDPKDLLGLLPLLGIWADQKNNNNDKVKFNKVPVSRPETIQRQASPNYGTPVQAPRFQQPSRTLQNPTRPMNQLNAGGGLLPEFRNPEWEGLL